MSSHCSPPTAHLFEGELNLGNDIIVEELPFVNVDMGDRNIVIVDEETDSKFFHGGGGKTREQEEFDWDLDTFGWSGRPDLPPYEHEHPPRGRKRRKRRKRPHDHLGHVDHGFDHTNSYEPVHNNVVDEYPFGEGIGAKRKRRKKPRDHREHVGVDDHGLGDYNYHEPQHKDVVEDHGFNHGVGDFVKGHFDEHDFDHGGYVHEDGGHPNEIGGFHVDEHREGGFEHEGFPQHHKPEPIEHEYHGKQ